METRASYMIVGAFVFLLFASAMGFVIWLGKLELDKSVNLYEIGFTGSVTGLSVASPVRYRGIPVGQVTDIQIDSENVERIDVTIEVDSDVRIKTDVVAILESQGLTGVGFIQLTGGSQNMPDLVAAPGEDLPEIPSKASVLEEVFESAPEIASRLSELVGRASIMLRPENQEKFDSLLTNIDAISGAFANQTDEIEALIKNVSETADQMRIASNQIVPAIDQIAKDMDVLADDASTTLSTLRGAAIGIDAEVASLVADSTQALGSVDRAAHTATDTINENRESVRDFTQTGLYELTQFLVEGRIMVESINRLLRQIERDPSRFIFGDRNTGVEASQ